MTTPLEDALSGIQGLRTITSVPREEESLITMEFELKRDLDGATNDVRDRVSQIGPVLPLEILNPMSKKPRRRIRKFCGLPCPAIAILNWKCRTSLIDSSRRGWP